MATYFFSGINKPELLEVLATCQASGMVNALSAGQPKLREAYVRWSHVKLALDYVEYMLWVKFTNSPYAS
jgi:hypothetical protein